METTPTTAPSFEIFDKFGRFVLPSDEQIATLDDETRERFKAVQDANAQLDTATANRKAAEQAVTDALAERDASVAELKRVRPKISAVANAKAWIASQRAEKL